MLKKNWKTFIFVLVVMPLGIYSAVDLVFGAPKPGDHVKNQLDAIFKGKYAAAAKETGEKEGAYKKFRDDVINAYVVGFDKDGVSLTQEQKDAYYNVVDALMKEAKYEITNSSWRRDWNTGDYEVTVKVTPLLNVQDLAKNLPEKRVGFLTEIADMDDETAAVERYTELLIAYVVESLEKPKYGDSKEITIKAASEGSWGRYRRDMVIFLSNAELEKLMTAIFPYE